MQRPAATVRTVPGPLSGAPAVAAVTLAYVAVLHWVYAELIAPEFAYLQYAYRPPDPAAYALVILLVVALALVLPRRITQPSHFVAWPLFVVAVVPSMVVPVPGVGLLRSGGLPGAITDGRAPRSGTRPRSGPVLVLRRGMGCRRMPFEPHRAS